MRLILFRHGPAGRRDPEKWPDDGRRPLTARGIDRTRQAARGLARLERDTARILTSPLVRAEQTARILHEEMPAGGDVETLEALSPESDQEDLVRQLAKLDRGENVILVGHEPSLGLLGGLLVFGGPTPLPLKKAGALAIRFAGSPRQRGGELEWLLPPKTLRRLARRKKAGA